MGAHTPKDRPLVLWSFLTGSWGGIETDEQAELARR